MKPAAAIREALPPSGPDPARRARRRARRRRDAVEKRDRLVDQGCGRLELVLGGQGLRRQRHLLGLEQPHAIGARQVKVALLGLEIAI